LLSTHGSVPHPDVVVIATILSIGVGTTSGSRHTTLLSRRHSSVRVGGLLRSIA
jgi:hypothetical protein